MRLKDHQDAYGHAVYDGATDGEGFEVVEREDGYIDVAAGPSPYLAPFRKWPPQERRAIGLARGRILDIGCGGGRVGLHLQSKGLEYVGIDNSPRAIKTCRLRGVRDARLLSITEVGRKLGVFDTIVMYGNNLGLLGSERRARWLLRRFRAITSPGARILGANMDPHGGANPDHRRYRRSNPKRGRLPGQIRLRIRYKSRATPWFDYLFVSLEELKRIVEGTGWAVTRVFESKGPNYVAVLEKS